MPNPTFLGFGMNLKMPFSIMPVPYENTADMSSLGSTTVGTDALVVYWKFHLMPDDDLGSQNQGGILEAHKMENRRKPFAWPGNMLQYPGHKIDVPDKTIVAKADAGATKVRLTDGLNLMIGRYIQLPGQHRVYIITDIKAVNPLVGISGNTDITVDPPLRTESPMNDKAKCTPVPMVKYDPKAMSYGQRYTNLRLDGKISLVEV